MRRAREAHRIREIESLLRTYRPGAPTVEHAAHALRDLLGTTRACVYSVEGDDGGYRARFCYWSGVLDSARVVSLFQGWLDEHRGQWGVFNPRVPEPSQRNRALDFAPLHELTRNEQVRAQLVERGGVAGVRALEFSTATLFRPIGIDRMHQLRVLVCDGRELLGWVGTFQHGAASNDQVDKLQRLVPAFRERLRLERDLEGNRIGAAVFDALPCAAYVLATSGRVVHANAAARVRLQREGRALRAELRVAALGGSSRFQILRLADAGAAALLALERSEPTARARAHVAAARWELSARQTQVLELLVEGASNRRISIELGCAEGTVEAHVSAILVKAECDGRAELVARVLGGDT